MSACRYKSCKEQVRNDSNFCIFHDKRYVRDNYPKYEMEVIKKFDEKVNNLSNDMPLECIGYYLPASQIASRISKLSAEKRDPISVDFSSSTLIGKANFSEVRFKDVNFYRTKFNEVEFYETEFNGEATFQNTKFNGHTYFRDIKFKKEADFTLATFKDISFSSTEFNEKASFQMANFNGRTSFLDVKFKKEADFIFAKFNSEGEEAGFSSCEFQDAIFVDATFMGAARFTGSTFHMANFHSVSFNGLTDFSFSQFINRTHFGESKTPKSDRSTFNGETYFHYVVFEGKEKIYFEAEDLSKVSFMNTDITRIRFADNVRWGAKDKFKVVEEEKLKKNNTKANLVSILSVYRNLRENYEYRLRYDDAGEFFKREMELKRNYREAPSCPPKLGLIVLLNKLKLSKNTHPEIEYQLRENGWPRRNFSLTGLYYHLSRYGESISRPIAIGALIVGLSTAFWAIQNSPTGEPSLSMVKSSSNFINTTQILNNTHTLEAFERSLVDFLPILSMPNNIKVGVFDFIVKIVGGALTFVLLGVALRRKFERKYTR